MIKFGSRTELILADDGAVEVLVDVGSQVRAGITRLARQLPIQSTQAEEPADGSHSQIAAVES
jgi:hypothetical protein